MTGLSVGSRQALAALVETVSDEVLAGIQSAVSRMPGDSARDLEALLDAAALDRARQRVAFAAVIPLFRSRSDGIEALTFPPSVLRHLWRESARRNPALLPRLDRMEDADASYRALARSRLYETAANLVRDAPDRIWPDQTADPAREAQLHELAACLDLGVVAHRAVERIVESEARPDADGVVELKLLAGDADAIDPEGRRRLMDIVVAHVADAPSILRLSVYLAGAAGRETLLGLSDTAVFVDRVMAAAEVRCRAICDRHTSLTGHALQQALAWLSATLEGMDLTVRAQADGPWAKAVASVRSRIAARLTEQLRDVPRRFAAVMPLQSAQTAGRMTRRVPQLQALPPAPSDMAQAVAAAELLTAVRNSAARFGVEALRQTVWTEIKDSVLDYADMTVDLLHAADTTEHIAADAAGDDVTPQEPLPDVEGVSDHILALATRLEQIEALGEARAVQRRIGVLRNGSGSKTGPLQA